MMNFKEIQELIKLINRSNISEFRIKENDFSLTIKSNQESSEAPPFVAQQAAAPATVSPVATYAAPPIAASVATAPPVAAANSDEGLVAIKSPIVGTFYRSASPEKPPFLKVGDLVEKGMVVCIIEAMKLFNEIESEVRGRVIKVVTDDTSPVEYDQVLFLIDPKG